MRLLRRYKKAEAKRAQRAHLRKREGTSIFFQFFQSIKKEIPRESSVINSEGTPTKQTERIAKRGVDSARIMGLEDQGVASENRKTSACGKRTKSCDDTIWRRLSSNSRSSIRHRHNSRLCSFKTIAPVLASICERGQFSDTEDLMIL